MSRFCKRYRDYGIRAVRHRLFSGWFGHNRTTSGAIVPPEFVTEAAPIHREQAPIMRSDLRQIFTGSTGKRQARTELASRNVSGWRRFIFATTGNAITEFALVMPIFLFMVCGITDVSRLLYQETTLQNAVRAAGRYATTGNHQPDPQ